MPGTLTLSDLIIDEDEQCVLLILYWFKAKKSPVNLSRTPWLKTAEAMVRRGLLRRHTEPGTYQFSNPAIGWIGMTCMDGFGFDLSEDGAKFIDELIEHGSTSLL